MTFEKLGIPIFGTKVWPTRKFSTSQIPDLNGKIVVITGGTSGLGLESAVQLAARGADVIILGSSESRGTRALEVIEKQTNCKARWVHMNLASIRSSRKSAEEIKALVDKIDILLLNAGVGMTSTLTEDGFENTFGCNHLGHFAFVQPLMHLFTGDDVRVVCLSSVSHYTAKTIDFSKLRTRPNKKSVKFGDLWTDADARYGVSKLANVLFAKALQRRLGPNVFVNAVHPGIIRTSIQDSFSDYTTSFGFLSSIIGSLLNTIFVNLGLTIADGALTQLYCCTSPEIAERAYRGQFFVPIAVKDAPSKITDDVDLQEKLWKWSEDAISTYK